MPARKFRVAMSKRCFRFKPDALSSHAPHKPRFNTGPAPASGRHASVEVEEV